MGRHAGPTLTVRALAIANKSVDTSGRKVDLTVIVRMTMQTKVLVICGEKDRLAATVRRAMATNAADVEVPMVLSVVKARLQATAPVASILHVPSVRHIRLVRRTRKSKRKKAIPNPPPFDLSS